MLLLTFFVAINVVVVGVVAVVVGVGVVVVLLLSMLVVLLLFMLDVAVRYGTGSQQIIFLRFYQEEKVPDKKNLQMNLQF